MRRIQKCAATTDIKPKEEQFTQAFGNILGDLSVHRTQDHLLMCWQKSPKLNGTLYSSCIASMFVSVRLRAALWHHQSHAPSPPGLYLQQTSPSIHFSSPYHPSEFLFPAEWWTSVDLWHCLIGLWGRYFVEVCTSCSFVFLSVIPLRACARGMTAFAMCPPNRMGWDDLTDAYCFVIYSWLFPGVY